MTGVGRGVGPGVAVGRGVAVGAGVGVAVGRGVGVGVGAGDGVAVGAGLGVAVGAAVGTGVGVGAGVGVGSGDDAGVGAGVSSAAAATPGIEPRTDNPRPAASRKRRVRRSDAAGVAGMARAYAAGARSDPARRSALLAHRWSCRRVSAQVDATDDPAANRHRSGSGPSVNRVDPQHRTCENRTLVALTRARPAPTMQRSCGTATATLLSDWNRCARTRR